MPREVDGSEIETPETFAESGGIRVKPSIESG
jgi:hypothetical protein